MPRNPPPVPHCPVCDGRGYRVAREGEVARAYICDCVERCKDCRGTGWVAAANSPLARMRPCDCQELERRVRLFDSTRIPGRHANSTRLPSSFIPSRELMPAMTAAAKFLKDFKNEPDSRGLIFHGDVGRGKTHLVVAILRELTLDRGISCKFVEFSHLLADLKTGFDQGTPAAQLLDPLVQVDVLAIDELGKGRNTEWESTIIDELVSRRYNSGKVILATTNYPPGPPTGVSSGNLVTGELVALSDRVGTRVYSRLREMCNFCAVSGDDYREKTIPRAQPRGPNP